MAKFRSRYFVGLAIVVMASVGLAYKLNFAKASSTVQLYLDPSSKTLNVGDTLSVGVVLNNASADQVNYVKSSLTFPADKLTFSSFNGYDSVFPTVISQVYDNSAGTVQTKRQTHASTKQGKFLVVILVFTVKSYGTATINFTTQSSATTQDGVNDLLTATAGGTYTINKPPDQGPPDNGPPNNPPNNPPSPSPTSSDDGDNSNNPADASNSILTPSDNSTGNQTGTNSGDTVTADLPVTLNIKDASNRPINKASVTISKTTKQTDSKGKANFSLSAGKTKATVKGAGLVKSFTFNVLPQAPSSDGNNITTQNFTFVMTNSSGSTGLIIGLIAGGTVVIALFGFILLRRHRTKQLADNFSMPTDLAPLPPTNEIAPNSPPTLGPSILKMEEQTPEQLPTTTIQPTAADQVQPDNPASADDYVPPAVPDPRPSYMTHYPWLPENSVAPGQADQTAKKPEEPVDMFDEGNRRLEEEEKEGLLNEP